MVHCRPLSVQCWSLVDDWHSNMLCEYLTANVQPTRPIISDDGRTLTPMTTVFTEMRLAGNRPARSSCGSGPSLSLSCEWVVPEKSKRRNSKNYGILKQKLPILGCKNYVVAIRKSRISEWGYWQLGIGCGFKGFLPLRSYTI